MQYSSAIGPTSEEASVSTGRNEGGDVKPVCHEHLQTRLNTCMTGYRVRKYNSLPAHFDVAANCSRCCGGLLKPCEVKE